MRFLTFLVFLSIPFLCNSQDLITLRNGDQIECEITRIDSTIIYYDFMRGDRKLSSFINLSQIRSYEKDYHRGMSNDTLMVTEQNNTHQINKVLVDTSEYVQAVNKWINLITYSRSFGLHATGWSVQYYGYNLSNTSKWALPVKVGFEGFEFKEDYFSRFNYRSVSMSYFLVGISPFYVINDYLFLNLGVNIIFGNEDLMDFLGKHKHNTFFGLSTSQGLYFVSRSKVGITLGLGIYEKVLSSEVYKSDIGLRLELGIKF